MRYYPTPGFCAQAKTDGYLYVWIDSCCINPTSSAELSEAINSMYRWYENAQCCYVFLFDYPKNNNTWFTRAWTLQELLAPKQTKLLDPHHHHQTRDLAEDIHEITSIPREILTKSESVYSASIAQRFSWASRRRTTRNEDMAYCLLGLFDIQMPLLYGEGSKKAFLRLQEEIMKVSDD
ncbi:hypothetical protein EJ04DRAFT_545742 [Polyplosphaeria fusca]|uniref:Heterokaryon incompatibility domain-containing protein n=1 Tax=Polyplosphaeria fusca TaxID=682080 RepID=A0A9P4QS82_9PLEO|nr:hypothetical protein EJ04DRAFT_545742 [Polyplosphaeria fusca]